MAESLRELPLEELELMQSDLKAEYERKFGRPYPPFPMWIWDRITDLRERIKNNDPHPPECNDPDRWY